MFIASSILLWHGLSACLGSYAERQWAEASALAASYGVDVTLAERRGASAVEEDNFLAHPYLKSLISEKDGQASIDLIKFKSLITSGLPTITEDLEAGRAVVFEGLVAKIQMDWLELLAETRPTDSAAKQVLWATEKSGIPWEELEKATARPAACLPPRGSSPPDDGFTAPENTLPSIPGLIYLQQIGRLRIHAAMACGMPGLAMGVLKIQRRLGDAYAGRPGLLDVMGANFVALQMLAGVKVGIRCQGWRPGDWAWLAGWAGTIDLAYLMEKGWESEIYFGLNYVRHLERFPNAEDLMFHQFQQSLGRELLEGEWSETCRPFGQSSLRCFRGQAGVLYRHAPPGAFLLWNADSITKICHDQLRPLAKGGLFSYAWPDPPRKEESKIVPERRMGENFMKTQSHLRLLIISQALRLWHHKHRDYPESLDALQENLASEFCQDLFSLKPLRYQRLTSSAYRLYSVGADLKDDGGAPQTKEHGDITWHHPE